MAIEVGVTGRPARDAPGPSLHPVTYSSMQDSLNVKGNGQHRLKAVARAKEAKVKRGMSWHPVCLVAHHMQEWTGEADGTSPSAAP